MFQRTVHERDQVYGSISAALGWMTKLTKLKIGSAAKTASHLADHSTVTVAGSCLVKSPYVAAEELIAKVSRFITSHV